MPFSISHLRHFIVHRTADNTGPLPRPALKNRRAENKRKTLDDKALAEMFITSFVVDDLRRGRADRSIADPAVFRQFLTKLSKDLKTGKVGVVTDYREGILREARRLSKADKKELAVLLFATWIEHFVNSLVEGQARKFGIEADETADMLRTTSMKAKVGWLLPLLKLPRMTSAKRTFIGQITEARNGFVHYKWKYRDPDVPKENQDSIFEKIDGLVRYLKRYEERHILHFSRKGLKLLFRNNRKTIPAKTAGARQ